MSNLPKENKNNFIKLAAKNKKNYTAPEIHKLAKESPEGKLNYQTYESFCFCPPAFNGPS